MTRSEHMQWTKNRALEYVSSGKMADAAASMMSDLSKHPETEDHKAISIMALMLVGGHLNDPQTMRNFINGFN